MKILYVVNHAAFFVSHRLPIAIRAREVGYEIALATGRAGSKVMDAPACKVLLEHGIPHERVAFVSDGMNPIVESRGLLQLLRLARSLRPDLIHCASPKGNLYGGLVARICGIRSLVLAISGAGFAFTEGQRQSIHRRLAALVQRVLSVAIFRHPNLRVIVQNKDDLEMMTKRHRLGASQLTLVRGSGVVLEKYARMNLHAKEQIVLLPARMLKDKGVEEFVAAARLIARQAAGWKFVLAGAGDYRHPTAIQPEVLERWNAEGVVQWVGHVDDMLPLFENAAIVCLPSYREGMPKALLEAAAAGCAVVTTDVPGCREAVVQGETGEIVPARNVPALAEALRKLIENKGIRERYAMQARAHAARYFGIDMAVSATLGIYRDLLTAAGARG